MAPHRRKRRRRSGAEILILAVCILLFCGMGVVGLYRCFVHPPEVPDTVQGEEEQPDQTGEQGEETPPQRQRRESCYTILVSGKDDDNGGSDTNILLFIDAKNKAFNAVSIPRDTWIDTDWNVPKFNASYNVGGVERLQKELSNLLGIPVDFYVSVDLGGFVELVDAIGGVWFDVPVNMNYDDPVQDLHIHFDKGYQYLEGKDAVKVVRFRQNNDGTGYPNGDLGRIETQQAFLTAVAKQMLDNLGSNPIQAVKEYASLFYTYIETDLEVGELAWVGEQALNVGMEGIQFYTLPGDGAWLQGLGFYSGSYYVLDPEATLVLVNESFNPYDQDLTLEDMDILVP